MTTLESNKMIAEFMGLKLLKDTEHLHPATILNTSYDYLYVINEGRANWYSQSLEQLTYHTSWDWLMPVVEKIESLGETGHWPKCKIQGTFATIDTLNNVWVRQATASTKLEATYLICIEFIQWYNNQSQINN